MKVIVVFGTRPEAIKMCPVVKEIKKKEGMECIVCVTGQHKEMLEQVLDVFKVEPDYNFSIMKANQTLYDITYLVMQGMREVLNKEKPDVVLVHGDTTTTFAAALACFMKRYRLGMWKQDCVRITYILRIRKNLTARLWILFLLTTLPQQNIQKIIC